MKYSILVLDDEQSHAERIKGWLEQLRTAHSTSFADIDRIDTGSNAYDVLETIRADVAAPGSPQAYRVVIADVFMPDPSTPGSAPSPKHGGLMLYDALRTMRKECDASQLRLFPKLVLISNMPNDIESEAFALMQEQQEAAGAGHGQWAFYLPKSEELPPIVPAGGLFNRRIWINALGRAVREANHDAWMDSFLTGRGTDLMGVSSDILGLRLELPELIGLRLICIAGESGTGKELVPKALHDLRKSLGLTQESEPEVVNLAQAAASASFHAEFFGYNSRHYLAGPGFEQHDGHVSSAGDGTLFLDEANPAVLTALDVELRRFFDLGLWRRFGETGEEHEFKGQIILASSAMAEFLTTASTDFRRRVGRVLYLKPLRDHSGDIPFLAQHFFERFVAHRKALAGAQADPTPRLTQSLIEFLMTLSWPGNVAELQSVMQFLADHYQSLEVDVEALADVPLMSRSQAAGRRVGAAELTQLLREQSGNRTAVAKVLGKHPSTVTRMIEEFDLGNEFPAKPGRPKGA